MKRKKLPRGSRRLQKVKQCLIGLFVYTSILGVAILFLPPIFVSSVSFASCLEHFLLVTLLLCAIVWGIYLSYSLIVLYHDCFNKYFNRYEMLVELNALRNKIYVSSLLGLVSLTMPLMHMSL